MRHSERKIARVGSQVWVVVGGRIETLILVDCPSNLWEGTYSIDSPLGKAVVGKEGGTTATMVLGTREIPIQILEVCFPAKGPHPV